MYIVSFSNCLMVPYLGNFFLNLPKNSFFSILGAFTPIISIVYFFELFSRILVPSLGKKSAFSRIYVPFLVYG